MSDEIPEGYAYERSISEFINHVGKLYHKKTVDAEGKTEHWSAMRVEQHHVNSWGMAHGGFMAFLSEVGTSSAAWEPDGPAVVAISMSMSFLGAPKLGELLEVRARTTVRTRSLVFVEVHAFAGGKTVFTATGINKIIGA